MDEVKVLKEAQQADHICARAHTRMCTRMHETKSYSCSKCVINYLKQSRVFGKPLLYQSYYRIHL